MLCNVFKKIEFAFIKFIGCFMNNMSSYGVFRQKNVLKQKVRNLQIVAFRMGNLQVTQNSCSCEWISLTCVLGALIRNRMGNFVVSFYSLHIIYEIL